jgi:hypothetical protein
MAFTTCCSKLDGTDVFHESKMFTLHDIGPLNATLKFAADSMGETFFFVKELKKHARYASMCVRSLLGVGRHCRVWEIGDITGGSVAVVVAETAEESRHLRRSYDVFRKLSKKAESAGRTGPLYSPQYVWCDVSRAFAVYTQVGERWTEKLYKENKLTARDVRDVLDQIKFFHECRFIHSDVAARNLVSYEDGEGSRHTVLIDAGSAVDIGSDEWFGGTVGNASVGWLEKNYGHVVANRFASVAPPSKQDELWSFVFLVLDLCFAKRPAALTLFSSARPRSNVSDWVRSACSSKHSSMMNWQTTSPISWSSRLRDTDWRAGPHVRHTVCVREFL